ncbi:MAG: InlB B-repeat-containing protein [Clostridia bacterium]|nr:InlB B-repeat-containing protein [Clostridia bacterium]
MKKRTAIILRVVFSLAAVALVLAAVQFLHTPVKATDSQAAGEYYIKVVVHDTNSSGFDSCENSAGFLIVPTIKQSGKIGQTWSAKVTKNQWDTDGGTWTYTGDPVNGFPTQLRKVQTKSATATDWIKNNNSTRTSKINFKIYVSGDNSTWTKVLDYDEETRAGGKWSYTNSVNSSLYPKLDNASCVITGPDVVYSNPNDYGYGDYTVSNAKDQYGVAWGYDEVLWGSMDDTTSCIPDDGHRVYFLINKKDAPGGYSTDIFPLLYSSEDNTDVMGPTKTVQVRYRMDTIAVGETKQAVFDSNSNGAWFEFTPTEDGTYIFYSMGHADPDPKCEAYTYNSASNTLDYLGVADDGRADSELIGFHQYEFFYKLTATKGTTYQFKVFSYNVSLSGDFPVRLAKAVTMTFDSAFYSTLGLYSKEYTLPKDATVHLDKTGVSRPGHTLVGWSINQNGAHRVLKLKSETIPASQTKIYALWLPDQPETLTPNTSYTVPMGDNSNGRITFYQFTPSETRTYVIYATGNTDTTLLVYDPETYAQSGTYEQFVDDATSPPFSVNSGSFLYQAELKAGQTYWFGVGNYYYDKTSDISFRFEDVYTVHYDLNDATLSLSIDDQVKYRDRDLTLSTTEPYRNGYDFLGWATSKDATQAEYAVGGTYSGNADVTLYAVWKVAEFTVKFCDYGGYVVKTETVKYGEDATPPPVEDLWRSPDPSYHYTFEMWDDSWFFITADRTVTAVYTPTPHTSSGWSSDDTRHWKRCETCQTLYYNYEQHTYSGKPQWGVWTSDNTVTATFYCDTCGHSHLPEVTIQADDYPATCTTNAYTVYSASVTMGDQTYNYASKQTRYQLNTKTGHTYKEPAETDWTWTPDGDGYTATVVVSCEKDDDTQTLTANVGVSAETPATHLVNGSRTYTATATIGDQTFTAEKTVTLSAAGHDWVHHDAAPAADCTATGTVEYWSCTGCDELRAADKETVITSIDDGITGPHSYSGKPQWSDWTSDHTVTATFKCDHCENTVTPPVDITTQEHAATCTTDACTVYSASVTMGDQVYNNSTTQTEYQPNTKTGHTYKEPAETDWTWTPDGDGYTATVVVSCEKDDDTQTLTANVGVSAETPATHLVNGSRTFTATATIGEQTFTANKTVTLSAAGHDWVHHDAVPAADCTATGTVEYWSCTGCDELRAADKETVITSIDDGVRGAHDWDYTSEAVAYEWDGYTKCTATVPCKHCSETTQVEADQITNAVTTTATCKVDGIRTYTAQFAIEGLGNSTEENLGKNASNHADYGTRVENENVVDADCMTPGSFDKVTYCLGCGEVIGTEHVDGEKNASNHADYGTRVEKENEVTADCKTPGSYDEVTYCLGCGEKMNSNHIVGEKDPANHAEYGTRVEKENEVTADCKTPASYDEVTYCLGCGEKISSNHIVGEKDAANHAEYGTRVEKENEVTADCKTPASYDEVTYCLGCGEKMNSNHIVGEKDPANHTDPHTEEASESTCSVHGYTEGVYCDGCRTWVSGHEELPLKAHTDADGDGKCDACGQDTDAHQHTDADGDGICDGCGQALNPAFRCIMCDFFDAHRGIFMISCLLALVHFFVHWLQSLFFGG